MSRHWTKLELKQKAYDKADAANVRPWLFLAQMDWENPGWNPNVAENEKGARGPAQIVTHDKDGEEQHPKTGIEAGFWKKSTLDVYNPDEAFEYAALWIDHMLKEHQRNGVSETEAYWRAFSIYNAGYVEPVATQEGDVYARDVFRNRDKIKPLLEGSIIERVIDPAIGVDPDPYSGVHFPEMQGTPFVDLLKRHREVTPQRYKLNPYPEEWSTLSEVLQSDWWANKFRSWKWDHLTPELIAQFNKAPTPEEMQPGWFNVPTPHQAREFQASQLPSSQPRMGVDLPG
jgi:hypothetical protein